MFRLTGVKQEHSLFHIAIVCLMLEAPVDWLLCDPALSVKPRPSLTVMDPHLGGAPPEAGPVPAN